MPAVLIPVITAAGITGGITIGATTITYASIIAYAVTTAATIGASLLLSQPKKQKGDPQQVTVKQALPPRIRSYGRVKVAGAVGFFEASLGSLYQLVIHGEGEWDAIEEWWLNDKNAAVSGGAVTVLPWGTNITIESHLGGADQAASPMLAAAYPGIWTPNHRLRGLAYSVIRYGWVPEKVFGKVYPNGAPALRVVARTAKVFDPRSGATAFSENPGLCTRDHLTYARGFGIDPSLIDAASFSSFANTCDEAVALGAGGTEPRYRVAFSYELTQEPREVLRTLLQSCDAEIFPTAEGKVGIRGGKWQAPSVTLTADHIRTYRYEQGNDKLAAFNRLKLTFTHRGADYQPVEIDPWEDLDSQAEVGVLAQDLTLQQVPSFTQARRLGKIFSAKGNPRHRLVLQTNLGGILALGERCVHVVLDELGLDDDFLIEKFEIVGDLSGCEITLASLSAEAYAWSTAEEGAPPTVPQDTSIPAPPPDPTGFALALVRTQISSGAWATRVRATVDPITGAPWVTIGRYRRLGSANWLDMTAGDDAWQVITGDALENDVTYEFQVALAGWGGTSSQSISAWTASKTVEVVSDPAMANWLPHSDDPQAWVGVSGAISFGGPVADPLGGTRGRAVTFAADSGNLYGQAVVDGALAGRTFTLSAYVRAPSGKDKIALVAETGIATDANEVTLTSSWQRVSKTVTVSLGATALWLGLDNRSSRGVSDTAAGVVEVFGGMVQERASATDYKSVP
ncbi:hypothetical protein IED13_15495 [Bosea sp. SSUT16]|uniref:Tip attachment protein J domain-containing protein n=1 Tax=Bosea spartocytisi TaxID=2773451 RepID=A0A927E9A4_9HYPH|nr:hypothetical protein [Bosea spartocytisi]MBD3847113.1 hypothetical protein [Bosea spartocytisi]MCT4474191.1 hypothetical protein [Bosea spartocytisi]